MTDATSILKSSNGAIAERFSWRRRPAGEFCASATLQNSRQDAGATKTALSNEMLRSLHAHIEMEWKMFCCGWRVQRRDSQAHAGACRGLRRGWLGYRTRGLQTG